MYVFVAVKPHGTLTVLDPIRFIFEGHVPWFTIYLCRYSPCEAAAKALLSGLNRAKAKGKAKGKAKAKSSAGKRKDKDE